jgi:hypothetical protein
MRALNNVFFAEIKRGSFYGAILYKDGKFVAYDGDNTFETIEQERLLSYTLVVIPDCIVWEIARGMLEKQQAFGKILGLVTRVDEVFQLDHVLRLDNLQLLKFLHQAGREFNVNSHLRLVAFGAMVAETPPILGQISNAALNFGSGNSKVQAALRKELRELVAKAVKITYYCEGDNLSADLEELQLSYTVMNRVREDLRDLLIKTTKKVVELASAAAIMQLGLTDRSTSEPG